MKKKKILFPFPFPLVICLGALTIISLLFIESASQNYRLGKALPFAQKQFIRLIPSFLLALAISYIPLKKTKENAFVFYFLGILLLISVFFLGKSAKGATRWIPLGPIRIQPSEFMKLFLILGLARYLEHWKYSNWKSLVPPFLITLVPMFLVLKQPDLGTSLLFLPLLFCLLFLKQTPVKALAFTGSLFILGGILVWNLGLLNRYQMNRVYAYLYPEKYASTIAYQQIQSQIAIGSGGIWGKGVFQGSQSQLGFLPERHTDFIFAVIGEEWGFFGSLLVIILLIFTFLFLFEIGFHHKEPFGQLAVIGIAFLLSLQAFINMGIATGILPVTGLTLPFISYGGSSTLMIWMSMGIVGQVYRTS